MAPPPTSSSRDGHKDYSGSPLFKKLGIREGSRVLLVNAPEGFDDLLEPMPPDAAVLARAANDLDVVVVFGSRFTDLQRHFTALVPRIDHAGRLWIAWPKKASKVETDITFETAQAIGLDAGLVDNKTAALTDVFTGLQFVYRVKDRPR
jgi:hypothetical protein